MCGISGIVGRMQTSVNRELLHSMNDAVAHRGPDGAGLFCENEVGLGHRRLSIIDLSDASSQPMVFNDRYVMVYNGEIYNYLEIKEELIAAGFSFKTSGDSEVLLVAYHHWGADCLKRFNGMWSFAIYDRDKRIVFCSRDRFGVKPFYYAEHNGDFYFGSEIKQLLAAGIKPVAEKEIVIDYLVLGLEEYDHRTFFKNIYRLLPGHKLVIDLNSGKRTIEKYYHLKISNQATGWDLETAASEYFSELQRSVIYRLRSDVRVGTCLSGGLDSSVIASLAARNYKHHSGESFHAITASSIDQQNDEVAYAKQVADASGLNWHITRPSSGDFMDSIDEVVKVQEEPFGSPSIFMQYFVMKEARRQGCPVLLDGQGGDETLLGYQRYYPAYLKSLSPVKKVQGLMNSSDNSGMSVWKLLQSYFYFTNAGLRIRRQEQRSGFLKPECFEMMNRALIKEIADASGSISALQILEITKSQLPHLLRYEDRNSMRFSIETRLPFLDYKLVEMALSINNEFKIRNGYSKYILRTGAKGIVPDSILWRKNKIGFEAPSRVWLSDRGFMFEAIRKSELLNSMMKNMPDNSIDQTLLWRLYNLAKWEEVFDVKLN
ncbi:MAG: asparagine synthase (glutamine-hydrolyzing) [Bacteroidetes bacterium]|nr:asparagine synthase (glutamine-hydrolyzing) [Bacteroidota bacterium]